MSTRAVDLMLDLGIEQTFHVVAARISEGISEITHAIIEIASNEDLDTTRLIGNDAVLDVLVGQMPSRRFTLTVGRAGFVAVRGGALRYRLDLYGHLWLLRFATNTRKFRDVTTQAILSQVLHDHRIPHRWSLSRPTPSRNYCVQYRETNLAFVERLLEFEGIYYTFDSNGVLELADRSSASPPVPGISEFELIDAAGALERDELGIHEIRRGARVASGAATVGDFNWKKSKLDLRQTAKADRDSELETYDYPAGYREIGEGAHLAQLRLEAQRVQARYVRGRGNVDGFAPAHRFVFGARGGDAFAGEYLLVEIEHNFRNPAMTELAITDLQIGAVTYENSFQAIPLDVPFRPARRTPRPTLGGSHTAMVRGPVGQEIHTDPYGRFKAQFHWDREAVGTDNDSRWVRQLQESATGMVLARVGWEMSIAYIDGDPDRPIGIARHINGVMPPVYPQPAHKNVMAIHTPSSPATGGYNEVRLDDTAGTMLFHVRAERDFIGVVKNDRSERIGNNEARFIDMSVSHAVTHDQTVAIGANSTVQSMRDYRLHVKNDRKKVVSGSETIKVGADANATTEGNETEKVGSVRITICGNIKSPDFASMVKRIVPDPKAALLGITQGALSGAMGGVAGVGSAGGGAGGGAGGALGGFTGGVQGGGVVGAMGGLAGGAGSSLGGLAGGAGSSFGGLAGGAASGAGALAGGFAGSGVGALGGALSGAGASLSSMIPTPSAALSKLTGGLSEGITMGKLIDMLCQGEITRTAEHALSRTVGGAFVQVGVGAISTNAKTNYVETVGGAKVTIAAKGNITSTVNGPAALTVGGVMIRKSKKAMGLAAKNTKVNVGGIAKLSSGEKIEIRGNTIVVQTKAELSLKSPSLEITLTPEKTTIKGELKLECKQKVEVTGMDDNLT
ncbi:type VI secretion system Vgr family protein [Polyangium sorediatum]|uniref:Type VI secretion system tip protein TssI/VgrG n=1 Tax=Polyangium sorediatum TaxID=889274 RepID=A0ABT6P9J2_9BACT|nr:type VI secretion system tip protein TssI/VgrG [Polyangium sorediatum]MDI1437278.1 type VI secretion system tip protein TssI/VgrG [Polyangium sorediatum]